jgi:bifunctional DNA-binding transcriptional regulator/antitoxin component of YhaV-PrlF toxin-antitoxin module
MKDSMLRGDVAEAIAQPMKQKLLSTEMTASGRLRLPKPVRQALHLHKGRNLVGFVIEGSRVVLTKATVVPESTLSEEEVASLARLSKRGVGTKTFRTQEAALRYLWSL